jgi:monovalent cation:H+ antiporter-2, CPA2 family
MHENIIYGLFVVLGIALVGGVIAKMFKAPEMIGYITAGILANIFFPVWGERVHSFSEIGIVLLMFSVGLELSLTNLKRVFRVSLIGASLQMLVVGLVGFVVLRALGIYWQEALILALGFCLSSTAMIVKTLEDRGEIETANGEVMIGWALIQDIYTIPIIAMVGLLAVGGGGNWVGVGLQGIVMSAFLVGATFFLERMMAPFIVGAIANTNSRELLMLGSISLALGAASLVSMFGISAAIGAFLAGVVIAETQENHAVFAETRPLRNIFVILFFVTLGFFIDPRIIMSQLPLILGLSAFAIVLKLSTIFLILVGMGYRGRTLPMLSISMSQIGEFSFVLFLAASSLGVLSRSMASVGFAVTIITLVATPFLVKAIDPFWRWMKFRQILIRSKHAEADTRVKKKMLKNHVIICGFGRVGAWVGRALAAAGVEYVVIDFNREVISKVGKIGGLGIYGDASEPAVLEAAGVATASAIILSHPDRVSREEVIAYCQTHYPKLAICARVHRDEDVNVLRQMRVDVVVQPEFEGALAIASEALAVSGISRAKTEEYIDFLRNTHRGESARKSKF